MSASTSSAELARRQVALLGKMLLYSIDHLTEEEQRIYDSLVEELAPRAEPAKIERASQPAVAGARTGPAGSFSTPETYRASAPSPPPTPRAPAMDLKALPENRKLQGLKPEKVVRLFVECWDKQDFKQEYFCLSDQFQQGKRSVQSLEEYVNNRYERFASRHLTGPISKQVVDISAPIVDGDMATVQVAERHTGKDEDTILYRTYTLHFENTAWRIYNFKTNQTRVRRKV